LETYKTLEDAKKAKKSENWMQKAWSAGIIDGEGCIHIGKRTGKNRKGFQLRVLVGNTDPKMILELKSIWGGWTGPCSKDKREGRKSAWQWIITDTPASKVLEEILPFLICKKEQATLAIEFAKSIKCNVDKKHKKYEIQNCLHGKLKDLKKIDFGVLLEEKKCL
jgi:hypothetical protein